MNPQCARCGKIVYPTEKVSCLDKNWHKGCFHCEVCKMTLNMKNYKGYDKKPYCNAHYPKTSFTIVADTPENLRLKQQSELQSQVKYKKDFEESKGRGFSIVSDTPEMQRLRRTQEQISNAKYHEDFERARGRGFTPGLDDPSMERYQRANQMMAEAGYKGMHPGMETDRRPGGIIVGQYHSPGSGSDRLGAKPLLLSEDLKVWRTNPGSIFDFDPLEDNIQSKSLRRISGTGTVPAPAGGFILVQIETCFICKFTVALTGPCPSCPPERADCTLSRQPSQQSVSSLTSDLYDCSSTGTPAPVLPGAYHQGAPVQQQQYHHGYMHQTSMSSVRSVTSPPHSGTMRVYRALYDYAAQDHDEVSFRDGDVIINAQHIDEGWMYGTVQRTGKSGMLPANYVECCN